MHNGMAALLQKVATHLLAQAIEYSGNTQYPSTAAYDQNSRCAGGRRRGDQAATKTMRVSYCTSCCFEALMESESRHENSRVHADGGGGLIWTRTRRASAAKEFGRRRGQAQQRAATRPGECYKTHQNTVTHAEPDPLPSPIPVYSQRPTSITCAQCPVGLDFKQQLAEATHLWPLCSLSVCHGFTFVKPPLSSRPLQGSATSTPKSRTELR